MRNEVLNCGASSVADDDPTNTHSVKLCAVGHSFLIILKVSENFGVDLTSAKGELKEDLRSLSRMQESESEAAGAEEGHI